MFVVVVVVAADSNNCLYEAYIHKAYTTHSHTNRTSHIITHRQHDRIAHKYCCNIDKEIEINLHERTRKRRRQHNADEKK